MLKDLTDNLIRLQEKNGQNLLNCTSNNHLSFTQYQNRVVYFSNSDIYSSQESSMFYPEKNTE